MQNKEMEIPKSKQQKENWKQKQAPLDATKKTKTKTKQNPHQRQICVLSLTDLKDNSNQYPSLVILTLFNKKI